MTEPSPYREPSKAEKRRNLLLLPLISVPLGISAYLVYGKEDAKGPSWFLWHPFMMMTAFFTLSGASILTKKMGGAANTNMHGNLMFVAAGAAAFGSYVIWSNKENLGKAHFTTPHGQFGALTLTWFILNPIFAFVAYNPTNGLLRQQHLARKFHKYSGKIGIAFGLITSAYGILGMESDPVRAAGLIVSLFVFVPFFLL